MLNLHPLQHSFHPDHVRQLLEIVHDVVNNMQLGLQTDISVLDFSKAFDKVGDTDA